MKLKVFSLFILTLIALSSYGQYTLSGRVQDLETQKVIPQTEVFIVEKNLLVRTDSKGDFRFENLPSGQYSLIVFAGNYNSYQQTVNLQSNMELDIDLIPFSTELSEVVIAQKREEVFSLGRLNAVEGTAIYAGKKSEIVLIDQLTGNLSANNARQIYAQVVGLNIYENNDAGLQLNIGGRGLDPNRTSNFNTRQNGYDISADVLGYPESYYTPPAEALSEIQVIRGAASLQYGTQFGGLLNFKFKQPHPTKKLELISRQSVGSFNLLTSFNSLSGTIGKFSYYTYFNYKQGDGFRPNSDFSSKNLFTALNYEVNPNFNITFEGTYLHYLAKQPGGLTDSQFKSDYKQSNRERNWFEVDWLLYALKLRHKLSASTDLSFNIVGLTAERNALGFRGDPLKPENNPIEKPDEPLVFNRDLIKGNFNNWGTELRLLHRYKLGAKDAVFLIGNKYYQSQNVGQQGAGTTGNDANFTFANDQFPDYPNQSYFDFPNQNIAFFSENIFFLSEKLSITPGARFEYIKTESIGNYTLIGFDNAGNAISRQELADNRILDRSLLLLGVGTSYHHNDALELYANISQNYRSVTFSDIRVVNPTFIIDPEISDERGYTSDFGVRGKWNKYLSFDMGGFFLGYNNRIGQVLVASGPDKGSRVRKNIGDAIIYGVEAFADWNLASLLQPDRNDIRINAFVNTALTQSQYRNSEENNVNGKEVEFIAAINLKTGLRFGVKNFLSSIQFTYLSQQWTDAQNTPAALEGDSREGIIGEIPAYSIMDVSLSYKFKYFKIETGSNNILNEKYFTRRATGYPGPGIIPSDPRTFYVTLEFKL